MDFRLTEEQTMMKTSARDFLEKECPRELVRDMLADERGYPPALWEKMAALGWMGLTFPREYGGAGRGFLDLEVLLEECGRALLPGPFLPTVVLAGHAILAAGTEDQKRHFLPRIASGDMIMTLAFMEDGGGPEVSDSAVSAAPKGDGFVINGDKLFVPYAHMADWLICLARTGGAPGDENGLTLFLVDTAVGGLKIEAMKTMSGEKLCVVSLNHVAVPGENVLGELNGARGVVNRVLDEAAVAECACMVGGARWVLETTLDYAHQRIQFGRPIGSFQAIQHKLADMATDLEAASVATCYAAWMIEQNEPDLSLAVSMAKAWCSDACERIAAQAIQAHGGIGFTWDYDLQLYFKRAKASQVAFGDGDYHRGRVADILNF